MYQKYPADSLPTMYDLPSEDPDELGLPSAEGVSLEFSSSACPARDEFHDCQPDLLKETCRLGAEDFFMGSDLNLYYDVEHTGWYKRPDWFLVLGVPASASISTSRLSYVMWQEQVAPFLMVELLSPSTEAEDLGQTLQVVGKPPTKWQVYEQILQVPYYGVFGCQRLRRQWSRSGCGLMGRWKRLGGSEKRLCFWRLSCGSWVLMWMIWVTRNFIIIDWP